MAIQIKNIAVERFNVGAGTGKRSNSQGQPIKLKLAGGCVPVKGERACVDLTTYSI